MERNNDKYRNKIFDENNKQINIYYRKENGEENIYKPINFKPIQVIQPKKYHPHIILTHHTPKARFKQYRKEREDAYHSYDTIIDNIPAGNGGTRQWNEIITKENLSNIFLPNNHKLQYDFIRDVNREKIKTDEDLEILDLYGKNYVIPEYIQNELSLPPSFCNLYYSDKLLFKLRGRGYSPSGWCKYECSHCNDCFHKEMFTTAFKTATSSIYGSHEPVLWIPPKAYNNKVINVKSNETLELEARAIIEPETPINLINRILKKYNKTNLFYDENLINYIYSESSFGDWQLNAFKKFISTNILKVDKDNKIYELWLSFIPLIDCIINNIQLVSLDNDVKIKLLKNEIRKFTENWKGDDLRNWCDAVMFLMYKFKISTNISNPMYKLHIVIEDMYKNRNNTDPIKNVVFGTNNEGQGSNFAYYMNQSDTIQKNVKNSNKFIFRSGYHRIEEIWNILYPDFDDYLILRTPDKNSYLKSYHRYTRGSYPKFILYRNGFRPTFKKLAKMCKKIIDYPTIRKQKILIIIFQQGKKKIIKDFFPHTRYPNLFFEYWYNIEGQNTYIGCTGVILFGCAGKPSQVSKMMKNMFDFPIELINDYFVKGEMSQGIGRIRPNLFPNKKWCIAITNIIPNGITEYTNFSNPEDIVLVPFLRKKNSTIDEILDEIYDNKMSVSNLRRKLKLMCASRILKRVRENKASKYIYSPYKDL